MPAQTSMLHVRVDDQLKAQASDALAGVGLTLSDAVRILLTRVAAEGGLPAGLTADPDAYDAWFRAKVQEALDDPRPTTPHAKAMQDGSVANDTVGWNRRSTGQTYAASSAKV
ncbi:type II toxin-antitoxin system RelB/DinJ family antitoxin [Paracoccus binzhouensis]|uniref:type II toxin-antitoxin system RelB/DinJ family antitoxin n=1 Tax=Paracoccus binzhouensis TaxID=2796149 RepID=UPI001E42FA3F|nr:type II toxin-antitoxin system RelB/DinJ family antitoxin [Paracoccus binzhouensis]